LHNLPKLILLAFVSVTALGQNDTSKNELGLLLGVVLRPAAHTVPNIGNINVQSGLTFQATYARKLGSTPRFAVHLEFPFVATPSADVKSAINAVPRNYASIFLAPSLRLSFAPVAALHPWVSVGVGYGRFDESSTRIDQTENTGTRGKNTAALQIGGGLDVRSPVRVLLPLSFRVEVRDFYSGTPLLNVATESDRQHNVIVSGGVVFHF